VSAFVGILEEFGMKFDFYCSLSSAHQDPEADSFMNAKRKLRLVLSTSDCHACDVRNNSVSWWI
jgi:hypothetical protein